jgi:hypothetical protein
VSLKRPEVSPPQMADSTAVQAPEQHLHIPSEAQAPYTTLKFG